MTDDPDARGVPEGCRSDPDPRPAWPPTWRWRTAIDPAVYDAGFAAGAGLTHRAAAALARGDLAPTA